MSLSSDEFARMILRNNNAERLTNTFQDDPYLHTGLRYFAFMAQTRQQLERELQEHVIAQQDIFGELIRDRRFQRRATPFIAEYR